MGARQILLVGLAIIIAGCAEPNPDTQSIQDSIDITIGTGGKGGVYLPVGKAICQIVDGYMYDAAFRCSAKESKGSVDNLKAIRRGDISMGIAQSDWHYHAYNGTAKFKAEGQDYNLRSIFSLYSEPFTIIAGADTGINYIQDLAGKVVNIGTSGSGTEAYWNWIWAGLGETNDSLKKATNLRANDASEAICDKRIDAMFWAVGHPSALTRRTVENCQAKVAIVAGLGIDKLVKSKTYLRHAVIPGGIYSTIPNDVSTFGVGATLVTTANIPEEVVYNVVKAVFENFEAFKQMHIALATLRKEEMIQDSLTAPLHRGALKYYKEAGLL
jgi:TRAP transporter TAXI family solute receptor